MKHVYWLGVLIALSLGGCSFQKKCPDIVQTEGIIAEDAKLQEISTEFTFTEGPAADAKGDVYFTDQPNNRIMVYTTDGELKTFMKPAGRSNGMYFDNDGYLLTCADENSEVWKIDVKTQKHEVLAHEYNGSRLNSSNDLWVHPDGGIYFTDPFYKRPWWAHNQPTQDGQHVYFLNPKTGDLVRVINDFERPNGIIGTPDGKTLYVADIGAGKTYAYDIQPDGLLAAKRLFCDMGSDGMTIDCCGNVYLTGNGVTVFNADGQQIEHINVPQRWTANVTFGCKERHLLFITAGTGVYTLQMNVCGTQ